MPAEISIAIASQKPELVADVDVDVGVLVLRPWRRRAVFEIVSCSVDMVMQRLV